MDKRILFIFLLCLTIPIYPQWMLQNHPAGLNSLFDLQFINTQTGWAVGENNYILKTTNGGAEWRITLNNLIYLKTLFAVCMIDQNTGFAVGANETILKTVNGGSSWEVISEKPSGDGFIYFDVCFINNQTGWISSNWGRTLKTTNGGNNWLAYYVNSNNKLYTIQFINPLTGWVAGETGYFRKTTDGGLSWHFQFFGTLSDFGYNSMHFIDENTGWLASYRDVIFKTSTGGFEWDSITHSNYCQSIRFVNPSTGWCGGSKIFTNQAAMYKTTDGGNGWIEQPLPFSGGFCSSIWPVTDSIAWAVYANKIIHTTNGGDPIGIAGTNELLPVDYSLSQNYPNPFNSSTSLEFTTRKKGNYAIEVYDIQGRKVSELFSGYKAPGNYKLVYNPVNISSGVYYYVLSGSAGNISKKMVMIK